jgi:hypothetical protein
MPRTHINFSERVAYVRNAKAAGATTITTDLSTALDLAIRNHQPGECPVILGGGLKLIGIDSIQSARATRDMKSA